MPTEWKSLMTGMGKLYDQGYRVTPPTSPPESSHGMIAALIRGQELARVWVGHWLSRPFHHLFNLMPGVEVGLTTAALPASQSSTPRWPGVAPYT